MPIVGANLRAIPASWTHSNEKSMRARGKLASGSKYLQLGEGEASSGANTAVVFDGGAADDGSEFVDGTGGHGCGFGDAGIAAAELATWL